MNQNKKPEPARVFGRKPPLGKAPNAGSHPMDNLGFLASGSGSSTLPSPGRIAPIQTQPATPIPTPAPPVEVVEPTPAKVDTVEETPKRGRPAAEGSENLKTSTYRVDEDTLKKAKVKALDTGQSINSVLVKALEEWIES